MPAAFVSLLGIIVGASGGVSHPLAALAGGLVTAGFLLVLAIPPPRWAWTLFAVCLAASCWPALVEPGFVVVPIAIGLAELFVGSQVWWMTR